jgi:anti-sigma factor RsiW
MQHLDEGTIHSWLDGALSAEEAARVSAHVEECRQCAAAVAEARGFIAASSRILTALDNVPKGVVPVSERAKPRNWAAWRAAAAVLVVALGSFAVLREGMGTQRSLSEVATMSARNPAADLATDSASAATAPSESLPVNAVATAKVLAKPAAPAHAANPLAFGKIANRETPGQERASAPAVISQPPPVVAGVRPEARADNATSQNFGAATMKVAAEPLSGRVAGVASSVGASGAAMSDVLAGPTSIRVVGTPRVIGEKRTLYEVAPGDTVLLAEALRIELNSVVVTALGATRTAQSTDTSAGRRIKLRGATSRPVAPDSQRSNAAPSSAAAAPPASPTAPLASVQILNGVTTLTWTDPASGNTMRLSGKHSAAELTEIRRRIEQLRAAEAAAKKKP